MWNMRKRGIFSDGTLQYANSVGEVREEWK